MSELIQQFDGMGLQEWEKWYLEAHPTAVDDATDKIWEMVNLLKDSFQNIDRDTVHQWVEELVIVKTFAGLKFQQAILRAVAARYNLDYRLATHEEERQGMDGMIGDVAVSIKPVTYKTKLGLNEIIDIQIIFYDKKKNEIAVEFDLPDLDH